MKLKVINKVKKMMTKSNIMMKILKKLLKVLDKALIMLY